MDQAFMFITHDPPTRPLTDEQVAQMKMPRARIEAIVKRLEADQEAALRNTGKGGYRVRLRSAKTTHMDFTDLALLGACDPADAEKANHDSRDGKKLRVSLLRSMPQRRELGLAQSDCSPQ